MDGLTLLCEMFEKFIGEPGNEEQAVAFLVDQLLEDTIWSTDFMSETDKIRLKNFAETL